MHYIFSIFILFFSCLPGIKKSKICDQKSEAFKFELLFRLIREDYSAYCFFDARKTGSGSQTGAEMEKVVLPSFSPTPGNYGTVQNNITITTTTAGASIYYTTDGSTPTSASILYTNGLGHIWSIAGRVLKAIAVKSGSTDSAVATAEYSYLPLKSGQTLCYDATTAIGCPGIGGDGATQLGITRSYTNNGDSTVTDNATGLLWQRCTQGYSGAFCTGSASSQSQSAGMAECAALTTASKIWRLPSRLELETLPDYGVSSPSINVATFAGPISVDYWTSTGLANSVPNAWRVNFTVGDISTGTIVTTNRLRCVSGNIITSFSKFTDNGDFTVKDNKTGLTWQKCSMGQTNDVTCSGGATTSTWVASIAACSVLNFAGRTWRLPNIKELQSLIDTEIISSAAINTAIFPSTVASNYWTSTGYVLTPTNGWNINFLTGSAAFASKGASYRVRCVSGP